MREKHILIRIIVVWAHIGVANAQSVTDNGPLQSQEQKGDKFIVAIHSNVAGAAVIRNGILSGKVDAPLQVEPGLQTFALDAPGFVSRSIQVNVQKPGLHEFRIQLQRAPRKLSLGTLRTQYGKNLDASLDKRKSLCTQFAGLKMRGLFECKRNTLIEDIHFAGVRFKPTSNLRGLSAAQRKAFLILHSLAQREGAEKWIDQAEILFGEVPEHVGIYDILAHGLLQLGRCERLLAVSDMATAHGLKSGEVMMGRAVCLDSAYKYKQGYKDLADAASFEAPSPQTYFHLAKLAIILQRKKYIDVILEACREKFPMYWPCYQLSGQWAYAKGDRREAERYYVGFLEKIGADPDMAVQMILGMLNKKDFSGAWPLAIELAKKRPQRFEAQWVQVIYHLELKKERGLTKLLPRLTVTRVGNTELANDLLQFTSRYGNQDVMEAGYRVMMRWLPQEPFYYYQIARIMQNQKRCGELIALVDQTPMTAPSTSFSMLNMKGTCQMEAQDYQAAASSFEQAIVHLPDDWRGYFNLAIVLDKLGSEEAALRSFDKAEARNPPRSIVRKIRNAKKKLGEVLRRN